MVRASFDQQLVELKKKLVRMGEHAQIALTNAFKALETQDMALADQVIKEDVVINRLEDELDEFIINMIASQQPVAGDLRKIMATYKLITSLERIGDFAVDLSKSTKRIGREPLLKPLQDLPLMFDIVRKMIQAGLEAYMEENVQLAEDMAKMDDHVDDIYDTIMQDLFKKIIDLPEKVEQAIQLAYVARFLERAADHATNMAEAVYYITEGKRVDLNR